MCIFTRGQKRYRCLPKLDASCRLFSLRCLTTPLSIVAAKKAAFLFCGRSNIFIHYLIHILSNFITSGAMPAVLSLIPEHCERCIPKCSLPEYPKPLQSLHRSQYMNMEYSWVREGMWQHWFDCDHTYGSSCRKGNSWSVQMLSVVQVLCW